MLNLFKKTPKKVINDNSIETLISKNHSYPPIVEEIHNEFYNAADKLLEEAKQILKDAEVKDVEKGQRLKKLGFIKAQQVNESEQIIEQTKLSQKQIELISYYSQHYPNNKFITQQQVKEICEKYNLVLGQVEWYKGFVPEKNLLEIENFKLLPSEKNILISDIGYIFKNAEILKSNDYYHIYPKNRKDKYTYAFQSDDGINFYGKDDNNLFPENKLITEGVFGNFRFKILNNSFMICAPLKDMDLEGKRIKIKQGYIIQEIPDPVVLNPVDGGYLIVTAWGDEASDSIIVNQKLN